MSVHLENLHIGVIGLGYVGLPLAVEFGKYFRTTGFDIKAQRVEELREGHDNTLECGAAELSTAHFLSYTTDATALQDCTVYIVSVPTPVDNYKRPDLTPLLKASATVGALLKVGDTVIYESTVYPGATEEACVPVLAEASGLVFNRDFFVGYSPERINPGDQVHRLTNIIKVTSGSSPETAEFVDRLYQTIIHAGTFKATSIRVAEAAKVIENTQRDVNIALMNELAQIFWHLDISTADVLEAAATKWNFLPFRPGLVGGHCIGVDPYYLVHKAQGEGYQPNIIPAARLLNERMGQYTARRLILLMAQRRIASVDAKILILGFSFKENCADLRNTRVIDIIRELENYHACVDVFDPWMDATEACAEYHISVTQHPEPGVYDALLVAVAHREFAEMGGAGIRRLGKPGAVLFDVKYLLPAKDSDGRL